MPVMTAPTAMPVVLETVALKVFRTNSPARKVTELGNITDDSFSDPVSPAAAAVTLPVAT